MAHRINARHDSASSLRPAEIPPKSSKFTGFRQRAPARLRLAHARKPAEARRSFAPLRISPAGSRSASPRSRPQTGSTYNVARRLPEGTRASAQTRKNKPDPFAEPASRLIDSAGSGNRAAFRRGVLAAGLQPPPESGFGRADPGSGGALRHRFPSPGYVDLRPASQPAQALC